MTKTIEEVARKLKYNFPLYSKNVLRIVNKEGESIPFRLNVKQQWVHSQFEKQLKEQGKHTCPRVEGTTDRNIDLC